MRRLLPALAALALALVTLASAPPVHAQSNVIPGTDIALGGLGALGYQGRVGTYPNGQSAFAMSTTSCNTGAAVIPFSAAMQEQHPFISFLLVRQDGDRMMQISDRSFMKHAWAATCGGFCSSCNCGGGGLGVGCSDTYGVGTNASRYWLGPTEELDPYLGEWNALGSFFDGTPVDGNRSYTGTEPNDINGRIIVDDSELGIAGSTYHYQAMYSCRGESESVRANNLGYHAFNASWTGSGWNISSPSSTSVPTMGSVLNAWSGANLSLANNGTSDGRVHVASKISFVGGLFHYEYALHNQDNNRGIARFTIPIDPSITAVNIGFRDIDSNAGNDWTVSQVGGSLIFETTTNPLAWNTIYNFWFDAPASPAIGNVDLDQFSGGPGANTISASTQVPLGGAVEEFCFGDDGVAFPGCTPCPCNNGAAGSVGGCGNSQGSSAELRRYGTASVSNDTLAFDVFLAAPGTFAVLISADNQLPQSGACPAGTGIQSAQLDGLRCVGGALQRHGTRATDGYGISLSNWGPPGGPAGGLIAQGGFVAGQTRYYQGFYRDSVLTVCGTGQNTTNGSRVQFVP